MNDFRCPECHWPNPPNAAHCHCGYPFFKDSAKNHRSDSAVSLHLKSPQTDTPGAVLIGSGETPTKSSNYFIRHWRGELNLPVAYWLNTFLPGWLISILTEASASYYRTPLAHLTKLMCVSVVAMWLAVYALSVWQLVGVWRSSRRRLDVIPRHPGRGWAFPAMGAVGLGLLSMIVIGITTAGPQVWELSQLSVGYDKFGPYNVRVLHRGTELEVEGALSVGVSDEVERRLLANPNVKVIHLNSIGGRIGEGHRLRDLISDRQLVTYSSQGCQSACTLAFLAGRERYLRRGAKLGFHQGHFPGVDDADALSWFNEDRERWRTMGIAVSFIERAVSTPNKTMWIPEEGELLAAHAVTAITKGEHFAATYRTFQDRSVKDIEAKLTANAFYRALKERDDASYQSLVLLQRDFSIGEATEAEIFEANKQAAGNAMTRYLPSAGDRETMKLVDSIIALTRYIAQSSPEACYAYLFAGTGSGIEIPDNLEKQFMVALAEMMNSSANGELTKSSQDQEPSVRQLMATLSSRFPNDIDVLNETDNPNVDKGKACKMVIAMYDEALKLPSSEAGPLLRYLLNSTADS